MDGQKSILPSIPSQSPSSGHIASLASTASSGNLLSPLPSGGNAPAASHTSVEIRSPARRSAHTPAAALSPAGLAGFSQSFAAGSVRESSSEWQSLLQEMQIEDGSRGFVAGSLSSASMASNGGQKDLYSKKPDPRLYSMEYLEKHQMHFYLSDALQQLAIYRPSNAVSFLAEYFSKLSQGKQCFRREYSFIKRTDRNRYAFVEMLANAGRSIGQKEVTKDDCHEFILFMCPDFPKQPVEEGYKVIMSGLIRERSPIFQEFIGAFRLTFVYADFMRLCANIFDSLRGGTNHVDKERFCAVLDKQYAGGVEIMCPSVTEMLDAKKRLLRQQDLGDISLWEYFVQLIASMEASRTSSRIFQTTVNGEKQQGQEAS